MRIILPGMMLLVMPFTLNSQCVNVALNKPATASSSWSSTPSLAFDGNCGTPWNAGTFSGWIQVDLQGTFTINNINLLVNQSPSGTTSHEIYTAPNIGGPWTLVETVTGFTSSGQLIERCYNAAPLTNVGAVRVTTTSTPSWVSWLEIGVFSVSPANPVITPSGPLTFCQSDSVTLTANTGSSYLWSTGDTTQSITVSNSGNYSVTVGVPTPSCVNGTVACTDCNGGTASVAVTVNPLPVVSISPAASAICSGNTDTLAASGAVSYLWSSGGTNAIEVVSPLINSTYTVTGTDSNGCANIATSVVNVNPLPVIAISASDSAICVGWNDTLTASGALSYVWSSGGTAAMEVVSPVANSTYTVTGTDSNGCINAATSTVSVNQNPAVSLGPDITQCEGIVTLDAQNPGAAYLWYNNSTAQVVSVSSSGTCYVLVTDVNGCTGSDTIVVTINANPVVALGSDTTQCGGSIVLDAQNSGALYLWNDNSTAQTMMVNTTGAYFVTVTNSDGCSGADTINVTINILPVVTASSSSSSACLDDADVILTGTPAGGTWSGPGVVGNNFDPSAGTGLQSLTYTYIDTNGCSGVAGVSINVNACVGFSESTNTDGVDIYPNPGNGIFTLRISENIGDLNVIITDIQGKVVDSIREENVQAGFIMQINLENQPTGVYLVHMEGNNFHHVAKASVVK